MDASILKAAVIGFDKQISAFTEQRNELVRQLSGEATAPKRRGRPPGTGIKSVNGMTGTNRPTRKISAAGRKRIAEATRRRWEEYRKRKGTAA